MKAGKEEAELALEENTILYNCPAPNDLPGRFTNPDQRTRYKRICSIFFTDTFFVHKKATTKEGFTCMQFFVSDKGFVDVYPMKSKKALPDALKLICKEIGAKEQKSNKVKSA